MGLNAKEIIVYFLRMIQVSIEASFTFIRRHPLISGVLLILCILYLFLSYIYHFLVYLSPFLVCTAIFVRIFWSSEEGLLSYVKKDEKKGKSKEIEKQLHKLPGYEKCDMLLERNYLPRNATSRRRNFTDKKWDVQDVVLEAQGKESSTIQSYDSEKKYAKSSENEENSSNFAEKLQDTNAQISPLQSETLISERVIAYNSDQLNNKSDGCRDRLTFEKEESSSDHAGKSQNTYAQVSPLEFESLISDQVKTSDSNQQNNKSDVCSGRPAFEREDMEERNKEEEEEGVGEGEESQDEEELQEEMNKPVEWSKDDRKNLMDLGILEIERNRRLESLIARRRARQQMKIQMEQSLTDLRTSPSRMAPLNITRMDPLNSPRNYGGIEGLEIPGSAPSALRPSRNPFDLPYDASEEKPNLTGDSFHQEFISKDMTFCRHESFSYGAASLQFDEESYPFFINGRRFSDRFKRLPDKGNHDLIIEKLFSKSNDAGAGVSTGVKAPKPLLVKFETTDQENAKSKTDIFGLRWKKLVNAQVQKSFSDVKVESGFVENNNHGFVEIDHNVSNNGSFGVLEKPEESKTHHKPINKKFLNFPIATGTAICEAPLNSLSYPTSKNQEDMPFPDRCIFHEPTCSIASDLQVEFSEIGSPTTLTIDGESVLFDGDIDKETVLSPKSDDLGPISINLRAGDKDIAEVSNNSPKSSSIYLLQKVEDVIDVSSLSSTSDFYGDSPTLGKINYDYNFFSDIRKDKAETQVTHPSDFLIGRSVDHLSRETQFERREVRQSLSRNSETEAQIVDHHVSSPSSTSDSHGDTPTHEKINYDYNVFSDMKNNEVETHATQTPNSSNLLISRFVDYPPHESQAEKPEERQNLSENSKIEVQVLDHHVNDLSATDTENSNRNEDLGPPVVHQHHESIDAVSINTLSSLSLRSLSPEKTFVDHVSLSSCNQHISTEVPLLNIEDMAREPPNSKLHSNIIPPIMQPLSIDPITQTHTSVSCDFQEPSCPSTATDDYNSPRKSGKLVYDDEDRKENDLLIMSKSMELADPYENLVDEKISGKKNDAGQEKFKNGESSEDKSASVLRQDDSIQSLTSDQMKAMEEINNKLVVDNDEVTSSSSKVNENIGIPTTIGSVQMDVKLAQLADADLPKPKKPTFNLEEVCNMHSESKKGHNEEGIKGKLKNEIPQKPSMLNDSSEEERNEQSESMKNDAKIKEKLKNDTPTKLDETNDSSEEVHESQSESKKNDLKNSNKEEIKEELKNDTPTKLDKTNQNLEGVSEMPSAYEKNDLETNNKEGIKEQLNHDTPTKTNKPNDSFEEVSKAQSELKKNDPYMGNKEEINENSGNVIT
ncbi:uncharacterized protein LOC129317099 isoform X1 [Prosopis cineraria]|uniref:uncharacterized protein LOC129317099 isoform X1 n=1 Tax=Prosopis cineraria TaxID=364024 RepID=UPI00240F455B|nr:uncharacterized protein LOC129317099 isoform X1 [Prosopis cineraria]